MVIFLYNLDIFCLNTTRFLAIKVFTLDPSNRVIKRLWPMSTAMFCVILRQKSIVGFPMKTQLMMIDG